MTGLESRRSESSREDAAPFEKTRTDETFSILGNIYSWWRERPVWPRSCPKLQTQMVEGLLPPRSCHHKLHSLLSDIHRLHGIPAHTPALASLAPECKGCLGTLCKGCHGTEQTARGRGTRPPARLFCSAIHVSGHRVHSCRKPL